MIISEGCRLKIGSFWKVSLYFSATMLDLEEIKSCIKPQKETTNEITCAGELNVFSDRLLIEEILLICAQLH